MPRNVEHLELLTAQHATIDALVRQLPHAPAGEPRTRLLGELAEQVTAHLALELGQLYPTLGAEAVAPLAVSDMVAEANEIIRVLAALARWGAADDLVAELAGLLGGHTAWQEEVVFARVAAAPDAHQPIAA